VDHRLRDELIRDEGLSLTAYKDSVGLWTIGVGHLLGAHARMTVITSAESNALLAGDVKLAEEIMTGLFPSFDVTVSGYSAYEPEYVRQRALVNMAFNLGNRLAGFKKFVAAVNTSQWDVAAVEMMNSKWAKQVGKRAERLRNMIAYGKEL
jgi:lysozyme